MIDRKKLGGLGEDVAGKYLERQGYKILERNWRQGRHEFDIIASKAGETIICEVKTRTGAGESLDALSRDQIRGLKGAMMEYAYEQHIFIEKMRLDFIALDWQSERRSFKLRHYPDIY
jgi:putative endonuclease